MSDRAPLAPTDAADDRPLLLKMDSVSKRLNVAVSTAFALVARGDLPCVRIGRSVRIPADELERWVRERTTRAG